MQSTSAAGRVEDFFDRMSKALTGKWAEIEVASLDLGDQIAAEWSSPCSGITYDSKGDLLDVALDRYDHLIRHPKQIVVDEDRGGSRASPSSTRTGQQIVRMKQHADSAGYRFSTIALCIGPSTPRSWSFSALPTLNLSRAPTRSSTSALKSAALMPMPWCAAFMSLACVFAGARRRPGEI